MKIGAERKKLAWLGGLLVFAALVYWFNSGSDAPPGGASTPSARPAQADPVAGLQSPAGNAKVIRQRNVRPQIKPFEPAQLGEPADPSKLAPTIRLDLLAKVQAIGVDGGTHRNIFKTEAPPPEPVVADKGGKGIPNAPPIKLTGPPATPVTTASSTPPQPAAPGPPPTAPINLKYYGYSTKFTDGERKAFFLDGEDVIVAAEGEIIKKQYKVVRITDRSVQMEDTSSKSTQTLPLQEIAPA